MIGSYTPALHGTVVGAVRRLGGKVTEMRISGTKTRYPGVFRIEDMSYRIRAVGTDPRTGRRRQVEQVLKGVTAPEAAKQRVALQAEISDGEGDGGSGGRLRISDYAKSWIESKARGIEAATAHWYVTALEEHILPALGDYYLDAMTSMKVQEC